MSNLPQTNQDSLNILWEWYVELRQPFSVEYDVEQEDVRFPYRSSLGIACAVGLLFSGDYDGNEPVCSLPDSILRELGILDDGDRYNEERVAFLTKVQYLHDKIAEQFYYGSESAHEDMEYGLRNLADQYGLEVTA